MTKEPFDRPGEHVEGIDEHADERADERADELEHGGAGEGIVLRASTSKWVWVLVGCLVFFTLGAGMALGAQTGVAGKVVGCVICALFGFCALVAVRELATPGSLVVSRDSFELLSVRRHTVYAFDDCGPFRTWRNPSRGNTTVVFDYAPDGNSELAVQNRAIMGGSRSLPDTFGISADDLARVLNDMRSSPSVDATDTDPA